MTGPAIGELFAGYGGIGMGLKSIWPDAHTTWVSDIESGPKKVLAHRHPDAPNLGDITKIDWANVKPVDIITGGSPCQDLSHAGRRAGMRLGTRSGLWASMCDAIETLRPSLVVWENVRGAYSAGADSNVEPCPLCVGDEPGTTLRALGRVLGDLAEIGYDAAWTGLRAADVGACHGRFRVFALAWPADAERKHWNEWRVAEPGETSRGWASADYRGRDRALVVLPTPTTQPNAGNGHARNPGSEVKFLPTPAVNDMGKAYTPEQWDEWTATMQAKHGNGNGHGKSLEVEAARLLPTVTAQNNENRQSDGYGPNLGGTLRGRFDQYAPAIARHEVAFGLIAPAPTEPTGKNGANRLSPKFTEWMMGLPSGHITDVPNITRDEALKLCGNGVVPQQCAEAVRWLLNVRDREQVAA